MGTSLRRSRTDWVSGGLRGSERGAACDTGYRLTRSAGLRACQGLGIHPTPLPTRSAHCTTRCPTPPPAAPPHPRPRTCSASPAFSATPPTGTDRDIVRASVPRIAGSMPQKVFFRCLKRNLKKARLPNYYPYYYPYYPYFLHAFIIHVTLHRTSCVEECRVSICCVPPTLLCAPFCPRLCQEVGGGTNFLHPPTHPKIAGMTRGPFQNIVQV